MIGEKEGSDMEERTRYASPLGEIVLTADEVGITGLWFQGQKGAGAAPDRAGAGGDFLAAAREWLDTYFQGRDPGPIPPVHLAGTEFQRAVWDLLLEIPYGQTVTYGSLARRVAAARGLARMSAQAVGGAVGRNPVSILVPCHRVVGQDGSLTGYAGGLPRKAALLRLEGIVRDA